MIVTLGRSSKIQLVNLAGWARKLAVSLAFLSSGDYVLKSQCATRSLMLNGAPGRCCALCDSPGGRQLKNGDGPQKTGAIDPDEQRDFEVVHLRSARQAIKPDRADWPLLIRGALCVKRSIMVAELCNNYRIAFNFIYNAMLISNSARPITSEPMF